MLGKAHTLWGNQEKLLEKLQRELKNLKTLENYLSQNKNENKVNEEASLTFHISYHQDDLIPFLIHSLLTFSTEYPEDSFEDSNSESTRITYTCPLKNPNADSFHAEVSILLNKSLTDSFVDTVKDTLVRVNEVAISENFLRDVAKKKYYGYTSADVINYINKGDYKWRLGGSAMSSRVLASSIVCGDYIYLNSRKQYRKGSDLAGTLFHEMTHNLGFFHSSGVPYPLGDLMIVHYARMFEGKTRTDLENQGQDQEQINEEMRLRKSLPFINDFVLPGHFQFRNSKKSMVLPRS